MEDKTNKINNRFYTTREAADLLGYNKEHFVQMVRKGEVKSAFKRNKDNKGPWLYRREEFHTEFSHCLHNQLEFDFYQERNRIDVNDI